MQPGETVGPGGSSAAPQDQGGTNLPPAPDPQQSQPNSADAGWQYTDGTEDQSLDDGPTEPLVPLRWSAEEFVHHDKPTGWYAGLAGATILVAGGLFFLTKDFITTGAIILVAIAFGVVAARKPRTLSYAIDDSGITIADTHYTYDLFKSFSVVDEGPTASVVLMPVKRFMPLVTLYYPLEQEEQIVDALGDYLPYEHRESAVVDNVMRRLRF